MESVEESLGVIMISSSKGNNKEGNEKRKTAPPKWKRQRENKTKITNTSKKMEVELGKRKLIEVKIKNRTPMDISRGYKKRRQEVEDGGISKNNVPEVVLDDQHCLQQ